MSREKYCDYISNVKKFIYPMNKYKTGLLKTRNFATNYIYRHKNHLWNNDRLMQTINLERRFYKHFSIIKIFPSVELSPDRCP